MRIRFALRAAPCVERWLPLAILATACVVVLPALAVWAIVPPGEVALLAVSVPLGMLLSVLAAGLGTALWKRTPGSRDMAPGRPPPPRAEPDLPRPQVPTVVLPPVELPAVSLPGVRLPPAQLTGVRLPAIEVPAIQLP